jgi:transposase
VEGYAERQFVGIDLHRRRSVIVRMTAAGERLETVRIENDPVALALEVAKAGPDPEVVLEATYGWYWAVDVLAAQGARVHLAHPLGVKGFTYRRVKNDVRDAADLADLLRMNRLPEAWIAPPPVRELRELVRHRAKLVALRSGLKAQVHAVLAKQGVRVRVSDLFGVAGRALLEDLPLDPVYRGRVNSLLRLIDAYGFEIAAVSTRLTAQLAPEPGYQALLALPGVGPVLAGVFFAELSSDRRRAPVPDRRAPGLVGRPDPTTPRVRHHRAPRLDQQAGLQAGALGRRRGRAEDTGRRRLAGRPPAPARSPSRREHRHRRHRPQAAHPGLLRPARRSRARSVLPPTPALQPALQGGCGGVGVSGNRRDRMRGRTAGLTPTPSVSHGPGPAWSRL